MMEIEKVRRRVAPQETAKHTSESALPRKTTSKTPATLEKHIEAEAKGIQESAQIALVWDGDTLVLTNPDLAKKVRRSNISASTMKGLTKCSAKWLHSSISPKPTDPFSPLNLGSEMHGIFEVFYDTRIVPVARRDVGLLEYMIEARADIIWAIPLDENGNAVTDHKIIRSLADMRKKWVAIMRQATLGILNIEDPKKVVVFEGFRTEDGKVVYRDSGEEKLSPISGIELDATDIRIAGVPFIGYIDRIRVDGYDKNGIPFLVAEDYKSSKRVPYLKPGEEDDDGDQVVIYAEVIRVLTGMLPEYSSLIYTKVGKERIINITDRRLTKSLDRLVVASEKMDAYSSTGVFPAVEEKFCAWCPLVASCPVAIRNGVTSRVEGTPGAVELGIPTVRHQGSPTPVDAQGSDLPTIPALAVTAATRTAQDVIDEPRDVKGPRDFDDPIHDSAEKHAVIWLAETPTMMVEEQSESTDVDKVSDMNKPLFPEREKPPFEECVQGDLNTASYASMAVFGLTTTALKLLEKEYGSKVMPNQVSALSDVLARVVNHATYALTGQRDGDKGFSLWQTGISTRIRGVLHVILETYPDIPILGGTAEGWNAWIDLTVQRICFIAQTSYDLWDNNHTGIEAEEGDKIFDALLSLPKPEPKPKTPVKKAPAQTATRKPRATTKKES